MAAKQGPNVLFCMPNRTKCILFVSVIGGGLGGEWSDWSTWGHLSIAHLWLPIRDQVSCSAC
jgi:hypothetical protein